VVGFMGPPRTGHTYDVCWLGFGMPLDNAFASASCG
jgi:hypothetical protein